VGCGNLYRLWNSHLARKGIIQFVALVLISQVELAYLPVAGYLRQMDSKAAELSLVERAIAMESAYYYYGAYVTADSGAVAVDAEDAGTGATEAGTETNVEGAGTNAEAGAVGMEATETEVVEIGGTEIEGAGATELAELADSDVGANVDDNAEGEQRWQDGQAETSEGIRIQIVDSSETGISTGIQVQPEIPQEEYFKQMLRENGIEDGDNDFFLAREKVPVPRKARNA